MVLLEQKLPYNEGIKQCLNSFIEQRLIDGLCCCVMTIIDVARDKALDLGQGLNKEELVEVLNSDDSQLEELAEATGGRVFDGTQDLTEAFRSVKGYN